MTIEEIAEEFDRWTLREYTAKEREIRALVTSTHLKLDASAYYAGRTAANAEVERYREALTRIVDLAPRPFDFPADWHEQIAACAECKRYEGHPIQQGICNEHRRPLWAREEHARFEAQAEGPRAKEIAREALKTKP